MATLLRSALALLALLFAAAASPAHAQTESKCTALKLKAAGEYFAAVSKCRSKGVAQGEGSDPMCVVDASDRLARRISKAERRGDCLTTEVELPVSGVLDQAVDAVHLVLVPTCCDLGNQCTWLSEDFCLTRLGTPGGPGTVCGGSGDCVAPPAQAGPCCEDASLTRGLRVCLANETEVDCGAREGTWSASALCRPNQTCVAP